MILLPYFLVSAFYLKEAKKHRRKKHITISLVALTYSTWLLYAAGLNLLFLSLILYAFGLIIFFYSKYLNKSVVSSSTDWHVIILR